jgi:heterodisulfide reductase subunit C
MALRRLVKDRSGQDVYRCQSCMNCELHMPGEMDIPLASLIQLVLLDDEEALESRTLWSDTVLEAARGACTRGLDLRTVMLVLRDESARRICGLSSQPYR